MRHLLCLLLVLPACGGDSIIQLPRELTAGEQKVIQAQPTFGLKLLRQLAAPKKADRNLFVSPLSISMALGMTHTGAASGTARAMEDTLALTGLSAQEINESYRSLLDVLVKLDPQVELSLANSIWYRLGLPVSASFLESNRTFFDAQTSGLDFQDPQAAGTINRWVSDKTRGRVSEIVESPIDPELVMFLINAVYFKGSWTAHFDQPSTHPAAFQLIDGTSKQVPMMTHKKEIKLRRAGNADWDAAELDYGGQAFAMTLLLPKAGQDLFQVVERLDAAQFSSLTSSLSPTQGIVQMPKLKLEYAEQLKSALAAMGMAVAFGSDADFSGMCEPATACPPGSLFISEVRHKTFVEVNEQGTEAAAATSVEMGRKAVELPVQVNRPYVFAIRERLSGTILFLGLIVDPTLSQ